MRLFFAVPVPPIPAAAELLPELKKRWPRVRWSPAENLHITLKFLGEVAEESARRVETAAAETLAPVKTFPASLAGLGLFRSGRTPLALWIGCGEGGEALADAAARLDEAMAGLGFPKEKRLFRAHLTLGRFPPGYAPPVDLAAFKDRPFGRFSMDRVDLMKSDLSPAGPPAYTVRREFPLRQNI